MRYFRRTDNRKEAYWCRKIHKKFPGCEFIPKVFGFIKTDMGPALVQERISNDDGSLGLKPSKFIPLYGRKSEILETIEEMFQFLADQHVVCNDISEHNILIYVKESQLKAVLIDGYGENHIIPYPTLSKRLNRKKLARKKQQVIRKIQKAGSIV